MKSKGLVPAVLLLTLSAPAMSGASTTAHRARTRADATSLEVKRDALSCENIALAGAYLRNPAGASAHARAAWGEFHGAINPTIRGFAGRFFRSASDIDDCCQEVWMDL